MQNPGRKAVGSVRELTPGRYQARITIQHKTYTRSFASKVQADSWLARRRGDARDPEHLGELLDEEAKTLCNHLEEWASALEENPTASNEKRRCLIRRFVKGYPTLCGKRLDEITVHHIHRFKQSRLAGRTESGEVWRRVAESTVNKELCLISKVFRSVLRKGVSLPMNPVTVAGLFPQPEGEARPRMKIGQEVALMNAAESLQESRAVRIPFAPLIQFVLHSTLRAGDIVGMCWEHVYWSRHSVYVPAPKNGEARYVPLRPSTMKLLKQLAPARSGAIWGGYQAINKAWNKTKALAADQLVAEGYKDEADELRKMRLHDLRFEAICRLFEHTDLKEIEIARMSGHKTPIMLWHYAKSVGDVAIAEKLATSEGDDWSYDGSSEDDEPEYWCPNGMNPHWRNLRRDKKMLQAAVNRQPMTEIAEDMGVSEVAVRAAVKRLEVEKPPRGHWITRERRVAT